jgi:hypothetical protein
LPNLVLHHVSAFKQGFRGLVTQRHWVVES